MNVTTQPTQPTGRSKGGRPRLLPEERRRHIFQPGFNDHEARQLIARAEQAGLDTVELIRRLALNSQINTVPAVNREALIELNRIGNNINQIATGLNASALRPLNSEEAAAWFKKTQATIAEIGRKLTSGV